MNVGRKILEALIVYSKIDVKHDKHESERKKEQNEETNNAPSYLDFSADAL